MARREITVFSMSFLDCICCGFGAIILLFVLCVGSKTPEVSESLEVQARKKQMVEQRLDTLEQLNGRIGGLNTELIAREAAEKERFLAKAKLEVELSQALAAIGELKNAEAALAAKIETVKANLDRREKTPPVEIVQNNPKVPIGVPVDANELVFVIDTSGSMRQPGTGQMLNYVVRKLEETLAAYPIVKGIQVLDADGTHIIPGSFGKLMPDNPMTRRAIVEAVRNYSKPSQSNPVPGIMQAIRSYGNRADSTVQVGIYVFGDEFNGTTESILSQVDKLNAPEPKTGRRPAVINGIGFPHVLRSGIGYGNTGRKLANLLRELSQRHGGVFVGTVE